MVARKRDTQEKPQVIFYIYLVLSHCPWQYSGCSANTHFIKLRLSCSTPLTLLSLGFLSVKCHQ